MTPATIFRGEYLVVDTSIGDSQTSLRGKYGLGDNSPVDVVHQVAGVLLSDSDDVENLIPQLPPGVRERVRENVGYPEALYEGMELVLGRRVVANEPIAMEILFSREPLTAAQKVDLLLSKRLAEHG